MQILAAIYGVFIGAGLITGLGHLFIWYRRRPRDPVYLSFGILALMVVVLVLFDMGYRLATSAPQATRLLNWGIAFTALALIALLWFVSYYTRCRPMWFLYLMAVLYLVAAVASVATPSGILYAGSVQVSQEFLPWGESFSQISGVPSSWQIYNIGVFLATFAYIFYAIYTQYRSGETGSALMLLAAIGVVIAATVYDFLIDFGVITLSIGLYPLSYIGLTVVMSIALADDVVRTYEARSAQLESARRWRTLLEGIEQIVVGLDLKGHINYVNPYFVRATGYESDEVIGRNWFETFIPSQEQSELSSAFDDVLQTERYRNYANAILTRSGEERMIVWSNVRLHESEGSVIGTLSVGRDVTDQLAAETALAQYQQELEQLVSERTLDLEAANQELEEQRQSAERRRSTAEGFSAILSALNTDRPLDEILSFLAVHADQTLGSSASLIVRNIDTEYSVVASTVPPEYLPASLPMCNSALTLNADETEPAAHNVSELPTESTLGADISYDPVQPYESLLAIPLSSQQVANWGMVLFYEDLQIFSQEDLDNAAILQGQVMLAIENAQLRQHIADQAVARERNRLSRELHDSVTQNLYTISSMAEVMPDLIKSHPEELPHAANNLRRLASGALAEMRTLLLELRPSVLQEKNLGELLQQLADGLQSRTHTQLAVTVINDRVFPQDVQIALYRIAQEALNNVIKHASADSALVGLYCNDRGATLRIKDDGIGFLSDATGVDGFGLENMRTRAAHIYASFTLDSQPDYGTEITVVWQERGRIQHG